MSNNANNLWARTCIFSSPSAVLTQVIYTFAAMKIKRKRMAKRDQDEWQSGCGIYAICNRRWLTMGQPSTLGFEIRAHYGWNSFYCHPNVFLVWWSFSFAEPTAECWRPPTLTGVAVIITIIRGGVSTAQNSTTSSSTISQNRPISNRKKWEEKNFLGEAEDRAADFHPNDLMCRKIKEEQFV
jgi:hypothetical protein